MVTKTAERASYQDEVVVRGAARGAAQANGMTTAEVSVEDVQAILEARLQSAYEKAMATPREEIAEPLDWWDLYGWGPWQPGAQMTPPAGFTGPLMPNQVIRLGEIAYVATILILNTTFPSPSLSAADILSKFALPYEIEYNTGELKKWQPGPANLQHISNGTLVPGQPWVVDVFGFAAQDEGLFEMNICARIFGCDRNIAPPFAGYATRVVDLDQDMFGVGPRVLTEQAIRFQCYR